MLLPLGDLGLYNLQIKGRKIRKIAQTIIQGTEKLLMNHAIEELKKINSIK